MRSVQWLVVLSSLIYPLCPAKADEVIIGSPLADVRLSLEVSQSDRSRPVASFDYSGSGFENGSLMDNFGVAIQQSGKAAGLKQDFAAHVDAARKEFFELYPDKPGVDAARKKLANLLAEIDLYYLSLYIPAGMSDVEIRRVAAIDLLTGGPFGHGIQPSSKIAFQRWVDAAREAMGAIPRDPLAGKVDVMTGIPIPNAKPAGTVRSLPPIVECSKPVVSCSQTSFVPTPQGYIEGIKAARDSYAYYVLFRDRAELSSARNVPLSSLPPITTRPPSPQNPATKLLVAQDISPFDPSVLGNNFQALTAMGMTLPNGTDKFSTYKQVVQLIVDAAKYKIMTCKYEYSRISYHFWSGEVPPAFSQLVYAVTVGGRVGDAARLGTKPVFECPSDEIAARELQRSLLMSLDRPNETGSVTQSVQALSHAKVGAIALVRGSYKDHENIVEPRNIESFKSEIDKAIANKQQILECTIRTYGYTSRFFFWYGTPPSNVSSLLELADCYNGVICHMGTSGRDACPNSLKDAKDAFNTLTTESGRAREAALRRKSGTVVQRPVDPNGWSEFQHDLGVK